MKNLMSSFAQSERCTTYFRDYAISQIKIAYRIMEYLDPDSMFESKDLSTTIQKKFLNGDIAEAVYEVINSELYIDISSSSGSEEIQREAYLLASNLYDKYLVNTKNNKIKERNNLLNKIKEIDKELGL